MKPSMRSARRIAALGAVALLSFGSVLPGYTEDDIDLEELRRSFRQQAAAPAKDFTLSESEIEAVNKQYEAEEAELLKKLSSPAAQALLKDVASGKSDIAPDGAQEDLAPVAITARAGTVLHDRRPDADSAPLVRAVRPASNETNAKASLKTAATASDGATAAKSARANEDRSAALSAADATVKSLQGQVASLRRNNSDLNSKLQKSDAQVAALTKQLEEAKNRLMMAETEVERLASVIEARNRTAAMRLGGGTQPTMKAAAASVTQVAQRPQARATEDTPVATVVAEKANLRTGPGVDNSPLMSVSRGTRLVVETRHGDWYRVVSPTGTRAWVSSDVVAFGSTPQSSPSRTVKIKGFDAALENETFSPAKSAR